MGFEDGGTYGETLSCDGVTAASVVVVDRRPGEASARDFATRDALAVVAACAIELLAFETTGAEDKPDEAGRVSEL